MAKSRPTRLPAVVTVGSRVNSTLPPLLTFAGMLVIVVGLGRGEEIFERVLGDVRATLAPRAEQSLQDAERAVSQGWQEDIEESRRWPGTAREPDGSAQRASPQLGKARALVCGSAKASRQIPTRHRQISGRY